MNTNQQITFPEHEKLTLVNDATQAVGEFLESTPYVLCSWDADEGEYVPVNMTIVQTLAEHFEIDMDAIEREKREMLRQLREMDS